MHHAKLQAGCHPLQAIDFQEFSALREIGDIRFSEQTPAMSHE
ncbi:hypothetical protein ACDW_21260 [Acidovorax sp. DW039]|nr:hypothetical protein ACDW_21260 [Acidovorax sp. DW039]